MKATLALIALAAASCVDERPAQDHPDTAAGRAWIDTPAGRIQVPYADVDGMAVWEGDIVLGTVDDVRAKSAVFGGAAISDFGKRWPGGVVRYRYHNGVETAVMDKIQATLDTMATLTPLTFDNVFDDTSGAYVEFRQNKTKTGGGSSEQIGMEGGRNIVMFDNMTGSIPSTGTVVHETLHAAGLWHEQARSDRDLWLDVDPDCIADWYQYQEQPTALSIGLFDFRSIMLYNTGDACKDPIPSQCQLTIGSKTWCTTHVRESDGTIINGGDAFTALNATMSREDLSTLWRMYAPRWGDNDAADHFGAAIAIGDLNADGYNDVAVGLPDENLDGVDAGQVMVLRGTSGRLVPWRKIRLSSVGATPAAADRFGAAVHIADLNNDGYGDLIVGVPGRDVGSANGAGAVAVLSGGVRGPTTGFLHTQTSISAGISEADEHFGAVVTSGRLRGQAAPELIVGAPDELNAGLLGGTSRSGSVFAYVVSANLAWSASTVTELSHVLADDLGAAIATGDLDSDGRDDLIAATPGYGSGKGAVMIYRGLNPSGSPSTWSPTALASFVTTLTRPSGVTGDRFGAAVASGSIRGGTNDEIVVGAPGVSAERGAAYVFTATGSNLSTATIALAQTIYQNGLHEPGDEFGASLAIGAFDYGDSSATLSFEDDLMVGSPGEDGDVGMVSLYAGHAGNATAVSQIYQPGAWFEVGDRFGAAIAAGDVDWLGDTFLFSTDQYNLEGDDDLVVGAPGEAPDEPSYPYPLVVQGPAGAGAIFVLHGNGYGDLPFGEMIHQETQVHD